MIDRLLTIVKKLRDPKKGCPWDLEQTFSSITPHTLEETWEVIDAVEREDFSDLCDELGDLLLQIVFYSQMATEKNLFTFNNVCEAISNKLERRHPHIFGEKQLTSTEEVLKNWEKIKQNERTAKAQYSILDDIPLAIPALMRAQKMQKRCQHVGFDWPTSDEALRKVYEEIDEVMYEANQTKVNAEKLEEEIGDLLFATVNLARHFKVNAETALHNACRKFDRRFREVEKFIRIQGKTMEGATREEMESVWQTIKTKE